MSKYIDAEKLKEMMLPNYEEAKLEKAHILTDGVKWERVEYIFDYVFHLIDSLQAEPSETLNGKFVFPKFLYARTTDNKTIDVSYAPQSLDAIEYIRGDSLQPEQPEVDFKIEERKWVYDAVDNTFPEDGGFMSEVDFRKILKDTARHFYELGLNARKEE